MDSDEENLKIAEEREEEAYQEIKDTFGVDPVKIIKSLRGMVFSESVIDKKLQMAELYYQYNGENVVYLINTSYAGSSWGQDTEDEVTDTYYEEREGAIIEIKEYQIEGENAKKYSANYKYKGVEYYLIGTMDKEDFEIIIDNLYFL